MHNFGDKISDALRFRNGDVRFEFSWRWVRVKSLKVSIIAPTWLKRRDQRRKCSGRSRLKRCKDRIDKGISCRVVEGRDVVDIPASLFVMRCTGQAEGTYLHTERQLASEE